jgi:hypothetical protein
LHDSTATALSSDALPTSFTPTDSGGGVDAIYCVGGLIGTYPMFRGVRGLDEQRVVKTIVGPAL